MFTKFPHNKKFRSLTTNDEKLKNQFAKNRADCEESCPLSLIILHIFLSLVKLYINVCLCTFLHFISLREQVVVCGKLNTKTKINHFTQLLKRIETNKKGGGARARVSSLSLFLAFLKLDALFTYYYYGYLIKYFFQSNVIIDLIVPFQSKQTKI